MKTQRHLVTFSNVDAAEVEAVSLAQAGRGVEYIAKQTGLSESQVSYRVTKAKKLDRLPKGEGYSTQWRKGTSEISQLFETAFMPQLLKGNVKRLAPKIGTVSQFKQPRMVRGKPKIRALKKAA